MHGLLKYAVIRIVSVPVSLFVVATLSFGLVSLIPGDPAVTIAGGFASPATIARIRAGLGLNHPWGTRYIDYLDGIVHGNLGTSFFTNDSVLGTIGSTLPATIELIGLSLVVAVVLGLVIGSVGAFFRRRLPDHLASIGVSAVQSMPDFVIGLLLIYVFFFVAGIAPGPSGQLGSSITAPTPITHFLLLDTLLRGDWSAFGSAVTQAVLPVLTLGLATSTYFAKASRADLADAYASGQIEFARACGLREWQVFRYALTSSRASLLTYGVILFSTLVGGDAVVETIFSWGGVGQWAVAGMLQVDVPVIQGFILLSGLIVILSYIALDILLYVLDPRLRNA